MGSPSNSDSILWIAVTGAITGIIGTILGCMNTFRSFWRDRVRVKVNPEWIVTAGNDFQMRITITNLSPFDITVSEMGFILNDGSRHNILQHPREDGNILPMRLQSMATNSVRWTYGVQDARRSDGIREGVKQMFVETSCGRVFKGGSPEWRRYTNHSLAIWPQRPPSPSPQIS